MVRLIGFLVGLGFVGVLLISLFVGASDYFSNPPEPSAEARLLAEIRDVLKSR